MGYLPTALSAVGGQVFAELRGQRLAAQGRSHALRPKHL